jgi:spore coat polysaccharide biosynthesis protein SpsF
MKTKNNISVIMQARMTSKRLPGKVLISICDKPIISHIIERLGTCNNISDIILAIADTKQNGVLEEYAKSIDCHFYRGSENDVLLRYYRTAEAFEVDTIVRITSDCPLVDPKIIDEMIDSYSSNTFNYMAVGIQGNFPRGLDAEVFSFETLKKVNIQAHLPYEREHVTPYIYQHPELFAIRFIEAQGKLRRPDLRLTVDTEEDLRFVKEIFKRLYNNGNIFSIEKVIDLLDEHPELLTINAHIHQKELGE